MTLGITLSFILIGPVFFMLIETSLSKGTKAAVIMNLGVLSSDIVCITLAYYSSREIVAYIQMHPSLFKIGAVIISIYGWFMLYSRNDLHFKKDEIFPSNSALRVFAKGFFLSFVNIGIMVFWISVVLVVSTTYNRAYEFFLYISIVLCTFFTVDLLKIFLASKFQHKFKDQLVYKIRRIFGFLLILSGIFLFIKSFFSIPSIDRDLPLRIFKNSPR